MTVEVDGLIETVDSDSLHMLFPRCDESLDDSPVLSVVGSLASPVLHAHPALDVLASAAIDHVGAALPQPIPVVQAVVPLDMHNYMRTTLTRSHSKYVKAVADGPMHHMFKRQYSVNEVRAIYSASVGKVACGDIRGRLVRAAKADAEVPITHNCGCRVVVQRQMVYTNADPVVVVLPLKRAELTADRVGTEICGGATRFDKGSATGPAQRTCRECPRLFTAAVRILTSDEELVHRRAFTAYAVLALCVYGFYTRDEFTAHVNEVASAMRRDLAPPRKRKAQ
jgi:hypothetical protein